MIVQSKVRQILFGLLITVTSVYSQDAFIQDEFIGEGININRSNAAMAMPAAIDNNQPWNNAIGDNRVRDLVDQILSNDNPLMAMQDALNNGHLTEIMNFINQNFIEGGMINQPSNIAFENQTDNLITEGNRNDINYDNLNNFRYDNPINDQGYNPLFIQVL